MQSRDNIQRPKKRVTVTIDPVLLEALQRRIDGTRIRSRSEAIEQAIRLFVGKHRHAVILAGGYPHDLYIENKKVFRALCHIGNETLIENIIKKCRLAGFTQILILGHGETITAIYEVIRTGDHLGVSVTYLEEANPKGTAKTLELVADYVQGDFLLVPCDTYFEFDLELLSRFHIDHSGAVTMAVYGRTDFQTTAKGVVELEGFHIVSYEEHPVQPRSHLIATLIAIVNSEIFDFIPPGDIRWSLQEDLFPQLIAKRKLVGYPVAGDWVNIHREEDVDLANQLRKTR